MMNLSNLLIKIPPISPDMTIDQVGDMLLSNDEYNNLLSLPVTYDGRVLGIISRYQLMNVFMKRFGRDLFGKKRVEELMNCQPLILEVDASIEAASQYVTQNMSFPITEDFILTKNGKYRGMGAVLDLLRIMEGSVERKNKTLSKTLKHLKNSQSQLVQSEKMASLGQMVAGVAHEINTPLGYVKSNVENLNEVLQQIRGFIKNCDLVARTIMPDAKEIDKSLALKSISKMSLMKESLQTYSLLEDVEEIFNDTLYGIDQISELVMSLKDFSRMDKARVDNVDLNDCINNSLLIAKNTLKYKVEVLKELSDLPQIRCSPSQINQVFLNLLTNAAQAIDKQGKILIKSYSENNSVVVVVEDNGKGITESNVSKIFDPFFTTKEIGKGTGMGLSISYKIIKDHGGIIKVASKQGVGTRFVIKLPLIAEMKIAS